MAEISKEIVATIARLSNIQIAEDEAGQYAGQLEKILDYINQLNELDTTGVPQTAHALPIKNRWRPDDVAPGWQQAEAVANAPDKDSGCFRVPRIIE